MDLGLLAALAKGTNEERPLLGCKGVDKVLYSGGAALRWMPKGYRKRTTYHVGVPHPLCTLSSSQPQLHRGAVHMHERTVHVVDGDALLTLDAGELLFLNQQAEQIQKSVYSILRRNSGNTHSAEHRIWSGSKQGGEITPPPCFENYIFSYILNIKSAFLLEYSNKSSTPLLKISSFKSEYFRASSG